MPRQDETGASSLGSELSGLSTPKTSGEGHITSSTAFVECPLDIQREIFELAARLDGRCALRLTQVARYVYLWVQPILYERVVLRSPESAKAFFRTLRSKPLRYFDRIIKSLAFDSSIPMAQAKPILVECSKFIILLSIFRQGDSPGIFLPFVNSPILRRLTLVERGPKPDSPRRMLSVRPEVFSSVTHLAIIRDLRQSLWDNLANTTGIRPWGTPENEEAGRLALKSLTHLAVSANTIYGEVEMDLLRRAAPNLKYLALLEASNIAPSKHEQLMMFLRSRSEHLRLVVMQNIGSTDAWNVEDFFRPSDFWTKVEKLIDDGYLSDRGDRWLPLRYSDPQSDAWV